LEQKLLIVKQKYEKLKDLQNLIPEEEYNQREQYLQQLTQSYEDSLLLQKETIDSNEIEEELEEDSLDTDEKIDPSIAQTFEKHPNSECVVNIILPRDKWGLLQQIRTLYIPNARCGPHFSFIDPFVK